MRIIYLINAVLFMDITENINMFEILQKIFLFAY